MKRFLFLVGFLISNSALAQTGWFELHPNLPGVYNDIAFLSVDSGYIITDNPGKIYSTTNGGLNWNEISLPLCIDCIYHLKKLFFANKSVGYIQAVTEDFSASWRMLFKTTNFGNSWFVDSSQYPHPFPYPSISDSLAFRADSIYFYKTIDGGKSWVSINSITFDSLGKFIAFDFRDANDLIVISEAGGPPNTVVENTTDGGLTWKYCELEWVIDYTEAYQTVKSLPNNVYLVGGDGIFRSADNGKSWNKVSGYYSSDFTFYNPKIGYTGGYWGFIQHTIDTGKTWAYQNVRDTGIYWDSATYWQRISTPTELTAYALANNSLLYKTIDGGVGSQNDVRTFTSITDFSLVENPVTKEATFIFSPSSSERKLEVLDLLGRVNTMKDIPSDMSKWSLDLRIFSPGIYFCRLGSQSLKMLVR